MNFKGKYYLANGLVAHVQMWNGAGYWEGFIRIEEHDIYAMWDKLGHAVHNPPEYSLKSRLPEFSHVPLIGSQD